MNTYDTILGNVRGKEITIDKYLDLENKQKKDLLADFFYHRLFDRYIKPFSYPKYDFKKDYKNGFSIMANCCLLIETFMSFKEKHLINTHQKSGECFRLFFTQSKKLSIFSKDAFNVSGKLKTTKEGGRPNEFYLNVRCGILHIGETKNGWKIKRDIKTPLFDEKTKTINATKFALALQNEISEYRDILKNSEWKDKEWENFRLKMSSIIKNCN